MKNKEFDDWFKSEMPNTYKGVGKEKLESFVYDTAMAAWQARVPEGYVVVPKEANSFMYRVFSDVMDDINIWTQTPQEAFEIAYKAMLEAVEK